MNLTLISAAISAAIGFGSAWQIKSWMELEDENNRITAAREAERELYALEQKRRTQVINAQNDARVRESKIRMDADAAKSAVVSLRDTLHGYVQATRSDPSACPDAASALSGLLNQCADRYRELGEVCSRHVSDIQTLISAWPK